MCEICLDFSWLVKRLEFFIIETPCGCRETEIVAYLKFLDIWSFYIIYYTYYIISISIEVLSFTAKILTPATGSL